MANTEMALVGASCYGLDRKDAKDLMDDPRSDH